MVGDADDWAQVIVVLDPHFGERLRSLPTTTPIWVVLSAENEPVIRALWAAGRAGGQAGPITGMRSVPDVSVQEFFLTELPMIELHHPNFAGLEVIGLVAGPAVLAALKASGFSDIKPMALGFHALRRRIGED